MSIRPAGRLTVAVAKRGWTVAGTAAPALSRAIRGAGSPSTTTSSSRGVDPSRRSRTARPTRWTPGRPAAAASSSGPAGAPPRASSTIRPGASIAGPARSVDPHRDAGRRDVVLGLGDGVGPVVEDRRAQGGRGPGGQGVDQVLELPGPARGDHRAPARVADRPGQLEVVAVARPVPVHARQEDLPRPPPDALPGPL